MRAFSGKTAGRGILRPIRRFVEDRRGVGAIEFAIVAPLLIMAYVGSFEISVAMTVSRKVSRAASTVSDLLSQTQRTDIATLDSMKDVVTNVLAPFSIGSDYSLKITGIAIDKTGKASVAWSRDEKAAVPYSKGTPVTLPSNMDEKTTFVVRTELTVPHTVLLMMPVSLANNVNTVTLAQTSYYYRRIGESIACTNCP